jgi:hypothetical protein
MPAVAAALIPTVGGLIGGLFGGKSNAINGTTQAEQAGLRQADRNTQFGNQFLTNSGTDFANANNFLTQAGSTLQKPADYYGGILSGNRANMMSAMAPEITTINNQANQARHQLATMGPMGGGRASAMAQLPMQTAGQIGTMFQQARPQAAQGLLNVGNAQGNLGGLQGSIAAQQGALGSGLNTNAVSSLLNYGLGRSQQNQQAGGAFGGGIYDILNTLGRSGVFGGGGNSRASGASVEPGNWGY